VTEIELLRRYVRDAADLLDEASSGFIPGCGLDAKWHHERDELVNAIREHLETTKTEASALLD
jgi:hypothetical protein